MLPVCQEIPVLTSQRASPKDPEQGPWLFLNIPGSVDTLEPHLTHTGQEDTHVCAQLRWWLLQLPVGSDGSVGEDPLNVLIIHLLH